MKRTMTPEAGRFTAVRLAVTLVCVAAALAACGQDAAVDPQLVGAWEVPVSGGRWVLKIDSSGQYAFMNEGGGTAPSHSGELTARGGDWSSRSTTAPLEDHGTYTVTADGLQLTGASASLLWARSANPPPAPLAAGRTPQVPQAGPAPAAPVAQKQAAPREAPRVAGNAPAGSRSVPETIDPCLLVTADEATDVLGAVVSTEQTTPQPRTQNDCRYRAPSDYARQLSVSTYNGRGIDPAAYLARRGTNGAESLPGVGDGAYLNYRDVTNLTSVAFVIGTATIEILVSGVPRDRSVPAMRALAAKAANRLTTSAAEFQVPGLERFVGAWLVTTQGESTTTWYPNMVFWVERDGELRLQTSGGYSGTMHLDGSSWRIDDPWNAPPPSGQYRVNGDRLTLQGSVVEGDLTRVGCGKPAERIRPPYDLVHEAVAGYLTGKRLRQLNPNPPPAEQFDAKLAGLWEGEGALQGKPTQMLVAIDDRGRSVLALFPFAQGRLRASDGRYEMSLQGFGEFSGSYHFRGGMRDGSIEMKDSDHTLILSPYDPSHRPPYATEIVGHCR